MCLQRAQLLHGYLLEEQFQTTSQHLSQLGRKENMHCCTIRLASASTANSREFVASLCVDHPFLKDNRERVKPAEWYTWHCSLLLWMQHTLKELEKHSEGAAPCWQYRHSQPATSATQPAPSSAHRTTQQGVTAAAMAAWHADQCCMDPSATHNFS